MHSSMDTKAFDAKARIELQLAKKRVQSKRARETRKLELVDNTASPSGQEGQSVE